jgi:hypothetical protein
MNNVIIELKYKCMDCEFESVYDCVASLHKFLHEEHNIISIGRTFKTTYIENLKFW